VPSLVPAQRVKTSTVASSKVIEPSALVIATDSLLLVFWLSPNATSDLRAAIITFAPTVNWLASVTIFQVAPVEGLTRILNVFVSIDWLQVSVAITVTVVSTLGLVMESLPLAMDAISEPAVSSQEITTSVRFAPVAIRPKLPSPLHTSGKVSASFSTATFSASVAAVNSTRNASLS